MCKKEYKIFLRPYTSDDIDAHCKAVKESQDELSKWFSWCDKDKEYECEHSKSFIETRAKHLGKCGKYDFAVINCDKEEFLGSCGLQTDKNNDKLANISYWTRKSAVGKGVATKAAKLLIDCAFKHLGMQKVNFKVAVCNKGSIKVAKNVGAKFISKNETLVVNNTEGEIKFVYEAELYQITAEEHNDKTYDNLRCRTIVAK